MSNHERRSKNVLVRMTPKEYEEMCEAARALWPGVKLSNAEILMSLARLKFTEVLEKRKGNAGSSSPARK